MSHRGEHASITSPVTLVSVLLPILFMLPLTNCAGESPRLQRLINEGLDLTKSINFSSRPEDKIATARKLFEHAQQYDPVVSGAPEQESMKARRFQRQEREKAATLLREAAED